MLAESVSGLIFNVAGEVSPLRRCFKIADGLNTITRRDEIGTSVPVFGLRPILRPFLRTMKEPNDDNLTVSPFSRQSVISFKTSSTNADDSLSDSPTCRYTAPDRSTRVTVFRVPVIACPNSRRRKFVSEIKRLLTRGQWCSALHRPGLKQTFRCQHRDLILTRSAYDHKRMRPLKPMV